MEKSLELANRAYEVVCAHTTSIGNWGFYLFSPDFHAEPELRHKIFSLWFCSLLDVLEAESRFLPEVESEARKAGLTKLADSCVELQTLGSAAAEVMSSLTREEQIFVVDFRNQLVHG